MESAGDEAFLLRGKHINNLHRHLLVRRALRVCALQIIGATLQLNPQSTQGTPDSKSPQRQPPTYTAEWCTSPARGTQSAS